jgi:hypothetical protein
VQKVKMCGKLVLMVLGTGLHTSRDSQVKEGASMPRDKTTENTPVTAGAFWKVDKAVARYLCDNNAAMLLADLIAKREYFRKRGQLLHDGSFFNTAERLEDDLNLSERTRRRTTKLLVQERLISVARRGIPSKNYYAIHDDRISQIIASVAATRGSQDVTARDDKTSPLEAAKSKMHTPNDRDRNKNKERRINKKKKEVASSLPPSSSLPFSEETKQKVTFGAGDVLNHQAEVNPSGSRQLGKLDKEMYNWILERHNMTTEEVFKAYGPPPVEAEVLVESESLLVTLHTWPKTIDDARFCKSITEQYTENVFQAFGEFWREVTHEEIELDGKATSRFRASYSVDLGAKVIDHLLRIRFTDKTGPFTLYGGIAAAVRSRLMQLVEEESGWFMYVIYLDSPEFEACWAKVDKVELGRLKAKPPKEWSEGERAWYLKIADDIGHSSPITLL